MAHKSKCALCRKEEELTFEHIPPRAAFNSSPAKPVTGDKILGDDRLPWDLTGLPYSNQQRGMGKFSLCRNCNNNTGSWYAQDYINFARVIDSYFNSNIVEKHNSIVIDEIHPLRLIKQIISMFCSINNFDDNRLDPLRKFVLDKEAKGLDKSKYKICCYFTKSLLTKYAQFSVVMKKRNNAFNIIALSEITAYPLGFILYFDLDDPTSYEGIDITSFTDFNYDDICTITFPLCIKEMNDILPSHYRTKEEILECIKNNKDYSNDIDNIDK